jgi:osmoprotectant transport system permease protein
MPDVLGWIAGHIGLVARTSQEHVVLSVAAIGAVLVIAIPLGIGLAQRERLADLVLGSVNALRTVPSLALLAIMLPVLGTGFVPSLVALTLYGLPAVLVNTLVGVRDVDREVVEAARGQGMSERQILLRIALPLAAPVIVAGIRTAAVQIVSAATLAVFIGGGGLGELISSGLGLMDMAQLTTGAILVALLAMLTEFVFAAAQFGLRRRVGRAQ